MRERAVGLVYAAGLDGVVASGLVDLLEIEPEMYWYERGVLDRLRAIPLPKIVHGVGDAIGGTVVPPDDYVAKLATWARELDARWTSHHLAFNVFEDRGEPTRCSFFLPPRQSREGVSAAARSIRRVADVLDRPFAIETGVNYLARRAGELEDGAFVADIARAADCHILLDLHNVLANERNGRQALDHYLAALPLDRVIEVHVAGGFETDGYWLDAHSGRPPERVMEALREWLPRLPAVRAVVFEMLPAFLPQVGTDAVVDVLEEIRRAWDLPQRPVRSAAAPLSSRPDPGPSPAEWECALGRLVNGHAPASELEHDLAEDRGVALLRKLVVQGRAGMLTVTLPVTIHLLLVARGAEALAAIVERYCAEVEPRASGDGEAEAFAAWIPSVWRDEPFLADALRLDRATARADSTGEPVTIAVDVDPRTLVDALARGVLPALGASQVIATVTPS